MSTSGKSRVQEEIKRDLFSGDDKVVMAAIHRAKEEGTSALVEPLIAVYASSNNAVILGEIGDMLSSLKVSNTEESFIMALENPDYKAIRKDLLGFIWNSGIQPVNAVALLSEIAVEGSFEEALECLTIVESLEEGVPEEQILEAGSLLRSFIGNHREDPKVHLLADLLVAIENRSELD